MARKIVKKPRPKRQFDIRLGARNACIGVRFTDEENDYLVKESTARGMSRAALVNEYFEAHRKALGH
jgi:hypothetical protein